MSDKTIDAAKQASDEHHPWIPEVEVDQEAELHSDMVEQEADHGRHAIDRSRPSNIVRRNR